MLNILLPLIFAVQTPDSLKTQVHIHDVGNGTSIEKIEGRSVTFGVKEEVEEILSNEGYWITDSTGFDVYVTITKIETPQQIINLMGLKWLRKDYIVETQICIGSGCFIGSGKRRTFIFAALLDIENNEVPLNRKSFSKALQESLEQASKFETKSVE